MLPKGTVTAMAKPQTKQARKRDKQTNDIAWVNYNLSDEQKAELKAQKFDLDDALVRLTEEDLKVTISYDSYNACYACFLIPKNQDDPNFGAILSGRGSTPAKSVKQACYIHWNIFDRNWSDGRLPRREVIDD